MGSRSRSRKVQGHGKSFHEKCVVDKLIVLFASELVYRVGVKYRILVWGQGHDHGKVKVTEREVRTHMPNFRSKGGKFWISVKNR